MPYIFHPGLRVLWEKISQTTLPLLVTGFLTEFCGKKVTLLRECCIKHFSIEISFRRQRREICLQDRSNVFFSLNRWVELLSCLYFWVSLFSYCSIQFWLLTTFNWLITVTWIYRYNNRGTQRQFFGKYLFGRRFEI